MGWHVVPVVRTLDSTRRLNEGQWRVPRKHMLTERQLEIFEAHARHNQSFSEIAKLMNMTGEAVKEEWQSAIRKVYVQQGVMLASSEASPFDTVR